MGDSALSSSFDDVISVVLRERSFSGEREKKASISFMFLFSICL